MSAPVKNTEEVLILHQHTSGKHTRKQIPVLYRGYSAGICIYTYIYIYINLYTSIYIRMYEYLVLRVRKLETKEVAIYEKEVGKEVK